MKRAFALSGGGNLGAMQAGGMRALVEAGIEPELLTGSSIGALNAAFYATHPGIEGCTALEAAWSNLRRQDVFRFELSRAIAGFVGLRDHLVTTHRLRAIIQEWLGIERIEEAVIPFAAVATDALSGEIVLMTHGDVASALLATAAIPGVFPPVWRDGRWLVDGSLSAGCPATEALDLGADEVFAFLTTTAPRRKPPRGAVAAAMSTVSLLTAKLQVSRLESAQATAVDRGGDVHFVPSPFPEAPSPFDFSQGAVLAASGYARATEWVGQRAMDTIPVETLAVDTLAADTIAAD
ncbi:MAG TPA: patatin-like phospholipase family protein [Acidimicrobiales bacterium]|jgi:NTE family protein|nr:patatin-like phospholipase family protein [Acidimicrobiales bacterium]